MKRYILSSFLILLFSAFFMTACNNEREDETNMDDTDQVLETPQNHMTDTTNYFWTYDRDYTYNDRDQFERDVKEARAKLDREITRLENKAENAQGETKEWYHEKAEDLKEERADLDDDWKGFANATEENWDDFKESVQSAWNDIEDSWNDIEVRINADDSDTNY